jgi:hypothetical protein
MAFSIVLDDDREGETAFRKSLQEHMAIGAQA